MTSIQIAIEREDAEDLLPLVEELLNAQAGTATGALWRALRTAIVTACQTPQ